MDITQIAERAKSRDVKPAQKTERDPYAAFDLLTEPVACEHGGTVVFATRKSTGVESLVHVPPSGRKVAAIPVTAILDAGFTVPAPAPEPSKSKSARK